ncbi:Inner membrane protein YihY, formerly thought to be RNase BN [Enhygromyxa salina]|uniref:Inner membrane protein YihY, formerly thought to be RNase BN n=1 Tax=Enhygromyxa salina TaxID=215803 RepID=A0A0C2CRA7_9BACT|nr:YhjD/YihY/BrkB family envelope integrity protein [Enhygromyxa salina]KIG12200.1 Inner membrane protein YihY, formerly thought to be RNase BN [Enhygromyxa salina]
MDPLNPQTLRARLARAQHWLIPTEPEHDPTPGRRVWLLAVYTIRRWLFADRCSALASSLALQTLLSVVPSVGVVLFFIGKLDPSFGTQFVQQIAYALGPDMDRAGELADGLVSLASGVNIQELGRWGLLVVIVLAFLLFSTLEKTVNEIWRVSRSRTIVAKFTMFYTLASLGPIVVFYSLAQPVLSRIGSLAITPVVTSGIGLILLNRFLPNQTVRWRAAAIGGLLSAALFEFGKIAFGRYLSMVAIHTYEGIYGSLAILPVFVVWAYLSWMIVLLGTEITFVVHHLSSVAREGYVQPNYRVQRRLLPSPGRTAARLLLAIADNYDRRAETMRISPDPDDEPDTAAALGMTVDALNERFDIGLAPIVAITDQLERAGLIVALGNDHGYVPGLPLEQITLATILHMFDGGGMKSARADILTEHFAALDEQQQKRIGELQFRQLIDMERARREGNAHDRRGGRRPGARGLHGPTSGSERPRLNE